MSQQSGGNTQFGCLLLLVPLVRAATHGPVPASRIDRNGEGGRDVVGRGGGGRHRREPRAEGAADRWSRGGGPPPCIPPFPRVKTQKSVPPRRESDHR
jgi:hypothetical protein